MPSSASGRPFHEGSICSDAATPQQGRFMLLRAMGSGATAQVYEAFDKLSGEQVRKDDEIITCLGHAAGTLILRCS